MNPGKKNSRLEQKLGILELIENLELIEEPGKALELFNALSMWGTGSGPDWLQWLGPALPEAQTEKHCSSVRLSGKEYSTLLVRSALAQLGEGVK